MVWEKDDNEIKLNVIADQIYYQWVGRMGLGITSAELLTYEEIMDLIKAAYTQGIIDTVSQAHQNDTTGDLGGLHED